VERKPPSSSKSHLFPRSQSSSSQRFWGLVNCTVSRNPQKSSNPRDCSRQNRIPNQLLVPVCGNVSRSVRADLTSQREHNINKTFPAAMKISSSSSMSHRYSPWCPLDSTSNFQDGTLIKTPYYTICVVYLFLLIVNGCIHEEISGQEWVRHHPLWSPHSPWWTLKKRFLRELPTSLPAGFTTWLAFVISRHDPGKM
jgi:hypothetical protein